MLTLQRLAFRLDLRELLRERLVLPAVELVEPVLRLEMSEQGLPNWTFGQARPADTLPRVLLYQALISCTSARDASPSLITRATQRLQGRLPSYVPRLCILSSA